MAVVAGMQKKRWAIKGVHPRSGKLAGELGVSELLAHVLIDRGIDDADRGRVFLRPKLNELIRPEKMPGVADAVSRILRAIKEKEKITVYGDYDVDGITAVAILWRLLRLLGGEVDYYIPHRIEEGYGLNAEAVEELGKSGTKLLITVDCGIGAFRCVEAAKEHGMDMVITDHHRLGAELPDAAAVVHPAIDGSYGNQDSAGAMVAFKLAWAVANEFKNGQRLGGELREFMLNATSLAAMGTVADVMDLRGENRVLVSYGLKSLASCKLSGVQALIESARLTGRGLDSFDIGFRIAPLLNAAGRMGHARLAVELLTSDSDARSVQIAEYLKSQNYQRRQLERKIFKQACEKVVQGGLNHPDRRVIVVGGENWHRGVIGIVASRLVDKFRRPAVMLDISDSVAQGSARSVDGFDLLEGIKAASEHLISFGGHKMAAGVKLEAGKVEDFAACLESFAKENSDTVDMVARLDIDAAVELKHVNKGVVDELEMLAPFGQGNPKPVFATKGVQLCSPPRRVGAKGDHLQISITDGVTSLRCIGFGMGGMEKKLLGSDFFNLAYQPQLDSYGGGENIQLVLTDIQFE